MKEEHSPPPAVVVSPVWKARLRIHWSWRSSTAILHYCCALGSSLGPAMLGKRAAAHDLQSAYGFISTFHRNFSSTQLSATALCLSAVKIFEISFHVFNCTPSVNQIPFWQRQVRARLSRPLRWQTQEGSMPWYVAGWPTGGTPRGEAFFIRSCQWGWTWLQISRSAAAKKKYLPSVCLTVLWAQPSQGMKELEQIWDPSQTMGVSPGKRNPAERHSLHWHVRPSSACQLLLG